MQGDIDWLHRVWGTRNVSLGHRIAGQWRVACVSNKRGMDSHLWQQEEPGMPLFALEHPLQG